MQRRIGTVIAAVLALIVAAADGPLVAIVGGLLGSLAPRPGKRNGSLGIR